MNERIKDIGLKAHRYAEEQVILVDAFYQDEYDKKFSELLVCECIKVVQENTASPNGYQALIKHFGVKE